MPEEPMSIPKMNSAQMKEHVKGGRSGLLWNGRHISKDSDVPSDQEIANAEKDAKAQRQSLK